METASLTRLSDLVLNESASIIENWIIRVMRVPQARELDRPTLTDHMPHLIEQLGRTLRKHEDLIIDTSNGNDTSQVHGTLRFQEGFDVVEVVAEYNALREVLYEFAERQGISIAGPLARIVNRTIDHAIAFAVKAFATEKTIELQRRREEHLSFVIHDLKTPLAAIETAMWIVDTKFRDPAAPSAKFLDIVRRNARRLTTLVSQILQEQANLQTETMRLNKRECDVWPLVEALSRDCQPLADATRTAVVNEIGEDLSVVADPQALSRVFQNLLSNAIQHTQNGVIVIGGRRNESEAEFWVEDSGEGISPERIDKIFDKLETDRFAEGGLGLGLAIVKEIVEAHGGQVTVTSKPQEATRFRFTIPYLSDRTK
jgi:signal transduction histidine kinase